MKTLSTNLGRLLMALALSTTLFACKKEKDEKPVDNKTKLVKITGDGEQFELTYNSAGKPTQITTSLLSDDDEAINYSIQYAEDGKIQELTGENGMTVTPVYDNEQLLRTHFYLGDQHVSYVSYRFTGTRLDGATLYQVEDQNSIPMLDYSFEYDAAGNISKSVLMGPTDNPNQLTRYGHVEYQYDNKKNPLYEHRDLLLMMLQTVSKNNPTQEMHYDDSQTLEQRYRYSYTYKTNDFPASAILKEGITDANSTQTQLVFFYQ